MCNLVNLCYNSHLQEAETVCLGWGLGWGLGSGCSWSWGYIYLKLLDFAINSKTGKIEKSISTTVHIYMTINTCYPELLYNPLIL